MSRIMKFAIPLIFLAFIAISFVWKADLRTSEIKNNSQSKEKIEFAKKILNGAIKAQGLDKINQFSTYTVTCKDNWKGMMGKMGNPWSWNNQSMRMLFTVGDFDGQVKMQAGNSEEIIAGIQSWDYYEKKDNSFNTDVADDKGIMFTLAAYHYFLELGNRLANAPIVYYAGPGKLKGKAMEKVFVT